LTCGNPFLKGIALNPPPTCAQALVRLFENLGDRHISETLQDIESSPSSAPDSTLSAPPKTSSPRCAGYPHQRAFAGIWFFIRGPSVQFSFYCSRPTLLPRQAQTPQQSGAATIARPRE